MRLSPAVSLFALAALVLASTASPARAEIGVLASYWETDELGEAGGIGLRLEWGKGRSLTWLLGATQYEELDEDPFQDVLDLDSPFIDDGLEVLPIDFGFKYHIGGRVRSGVYVGGGATYYLLDSDAAGSSLDDEIGYFGLLGYRFGGAQSRFQFFVEGQYRQVDAELTADVLDQPAELALDGLAINVGVSF